MKRKVGARASVSSSSSVPVLHAHARARARARRRLEYPQRRRSSVGRDERRGRVCRLLLQSKRAAAGARPPRSRSPAGPATSGGSHNSDGRRTFKRARARVLAADHSTVSLSRDFWRVGERPTAATRRALSPCCRLNTQLARARAAWLAVNGIKPAASRRTQTKRRLARIASET